MKAKTIDINLTGDTLQHLCVNDTIDIVIVKEQNNYTVKVLSTKNSNLGVNTEIINFEEYEELINS